MSSEDDPRRLGDVIRELDELGTREQALERERHGLVARLALPLVERALDEDTQRRSRIGLPAFMPQQEIGDSEVFRDAGREMPRPGYVARLVASGGVL